ncbi:MAG TPA: hypothetical protein VE262_07430 [Blastocatellia bacterium]|nr:hypothetical protein [Blastocatellia bacterium]
MKSISRRKVLTQVLPATALGLALSHPASAADQPHMQAALDALRVAKKELEAASADKGGHRARAQRLVGQAIAEVERGIRFDRRN